MSYEVLDPEKPEPKRGGEIANAETFRYQRPIPFKTSPTVQPTLNPNRAGFVGMVMIYHADMQDVLNGRRGGSIELGQPFPLLVTFVHGTESHAESVLNGYVFFDSCGMEFKRGIRRGDGAGQWGFSNLTGLGFAPGTPG